MQIFATLQDINIGSFSLASILSAVIAFLLCSVAVKLANRLLNRAMEKPHFDNSIKNLIRTIAKIALWSLTAIIVADTLGIPTTSLVAVLSVAGLALSLSIQDIMSNVFSGITLLITRPFTTGDWIEINSISGMVKNVGLFYTIILTVDKRTVHIPNSSVVTSQIANHDSDSLRRTNVTIGVSYDCSTELVKKALTEAVLADSKILHEPEEPRIILSNYLDSAIEYTVRAWCHHEDYWEVLYTLNENIRESFERNQVEIPYNHLNIHVCKD